MNPTGQELEDFHAGLHIYVHSRHPALWASSINLLIEITHILPNATLSLIHIRFLSILLPNTRAIL
jgi:hypothetical protein